MRSAVLALAAIAALVGCKDKQPDKAPSPTAQPATPGTPAGDRPALERPVGEPSVLKPVGKLSATVSLQRDALLLDGVSLGAIHDGKVDKSKLDGLTRRLEALGSDDPVGITIDPRLPYLRVSELLAALGTAGFRNLAFIGGSGLAMVPLELGDPEQANVGSVRPVVTVRGGNVSLWSVTGEEGTQDKPKASVGAGQSIEPITKALVEIVERRWPDGTRPAADRTIIVQVSAKEPAERMIQILAAVRSEGRLELFPSVFLAGGI